MSHHLKKKGQRLSSPSKLSKIYMTVALPLIVAVSGSVFAGTYQDRFEEIRDEIYNPDNGYLSPDGGPYHSIETFMVEAPDYGHESTSEAYSYILWLEAMHGKITGDWEPLVEAWDLIEAHIIPTSEMQPSAANFASGIATYVPEGLLPSEYPLPLTDSAAVGEEPISAQLAAQYGTWDIYGMHWLLDMDNVYGYGNFADGESTPSYINTFQRGEQESVWETVPHPSWEEFNWGGDFGFLDLFVSEPWDPAEQWRYTNAPDADARAVQVMYWALQWMKEQGVDPEDVAPGLMAKAAKMGDYLRLAMFDKYFKVIGSQDEYGSAGQGYDSAHYLMSWYYSWGGPVDTSQSWAWRIGSSHIHYAYQNPIAAYALSQVEELMPETVNSASDWETSLERSLQFLQWTQSAEGAFSGGATNSWNGTYDTYPTERADATFYGMVYDENPVYEDPGSGTWFGWQAWGIERLCEYYYITGEARTKAILDKWAGWVLDQSPDAGYPVLDYTEDGLKIASTLEFTGYPETWDADNPLENSDLHVEVVGQNQDVGVAHSLAKALIYYAAAYQTHEGAVHTEAKEAAQYILDYFWDNFRDDKGVAAPETRGDYAERIEESIYIPDGWTGENAVGGVLDSDTTFMSMRPFYYDDPGYEEVLAAIAEDRDPEYTYHRYWAQVDVATANALYEDLLMDTEDPVDPIDPVDPVDPVAPTASDIAVETDQDTSVGITLKGVDSDGYIVSYDTSSPSHGSLSGSGSTVTYTPDTGFYGSDSFEYTVTDNDGMTSDAATVTVTVLEVIEEPEPENTAPEACFTLSPTSAEVGETISMSAACASDADGDSLSYSWSFGDGSTASGVSTSHAYSAAGQYTVILTVSDGEDSDSVSQTVTITEVEEPVDPVDPGTATCEYDLQSEWNTGFVGQITITNNSSETIDGWEVSWSYSDGSVITNYWNYVASGSYTASNLSWNASIAPGGSVTFGFQGNKATYDASAEIPTVTGSICN